VSMTWSIMSLTFTILSFLADSFIKFISLIIFYIILKHISINETFCDYRKVFRQVANISSLFSIYLSYKTDFKMIHYGSSLTVISFWSINKEIIISDCSKVVSLFYISNRIFISIVILNEQSYVAAYSRNVSFSGPTNSTIKLQKTVISLIFSSSFLIFLMT
jgi:hypothetical protein